LRRADDLAEPAGTARQDLVALIAARIGRTRLIDNLACATGATHDL
jgi:pantoate--beta-alanine ligase